MTQPSERDKIVALVTGASRGLGRAMAQGLLAAGHSVVAMARPGSEVALESLIQPVGPPRDRLLCLTGDICSEDACRAVLARACECFGTVHAVVNNAGLGMDLVGPQVARPRPFFEVDSAKWRRIVDTNINGTFTMSKVMVPHLLAQGWGRVVNLSTQFVTMQRVGFSPYGPTRAAVEAMTVIWAKEFAGTGVTVNALLPGGAADTDMILPEDFADRSRLIRPEVMVPPLLWLLSRASDGVTGQRFVAKNWLPSAPLAEAIAAAGAAAGW